MYLVTHWPTFLEISHPLPHCYSVTVLKSIWTYFGLVPGYFGPGKMSQGALNAALEASLNFDILILLTSYLQMSVWRPFHSYTQVMHTTRAAVRCRVVLDVLGGLTAETSSEKRKMHMEPECATLFFLFPHLSFITGQMYCFNPFGLYMFYQRFVWKSSVIGINRISKSSQMRVIIMLHIDKTEITVIARALPYYCGFDHVWYFTWSIDLAWEEQALPCVSHYTKNSWPLIFLWL